MRHKSISVWSNCRGIVVLTTIVWQWSLCALSLSLCVLQGLMSHNLTENLLLGMLK